MIARVFVCLLAGIAASLAQEAASFPAPKSLGNVAEYGRNLQRTMKLLATSTPEERHTVKVLFYGQSITEQKWTERVAEDLRARFPHANLIVENRAIGGHAAQLLVKTAEADLYPFQPDLLIFHVYGSHLEYENIISRVRERTTAEILQQNDHVTKPEAMSEETEAAKLTPAKWDPFMNHNFLPGIARKYGTEFCDQRALWKRYLKDHALAPSALLRDGVHLNAHGEFLMAEIVKAHLRFDPAREPSPTEGWVKTFRVGKDCQWKEGKLVLEFEGNRVEAIASGAVTQPNEIWIDGRKPSEFPELYSFTRTSPYPQSSWPCILKVGRQKALQTEEWTLTFKQTTGNWRSWKFEVVGSATGADGAGECGQRFVSNSGRIVLEPDDWNLEFCIKVHGPKVQDGFVVKWQAVPHFANRLQTEPAAGPGLEVVQTLTQGLINERHTLEIIGEPIPELTALRVYTPPMHRVMLQGK